MMEQKIDPPNLGFWTPAIKGFQNILAIFQKKSVGCRWNWKILKRDKSSKKIKEFYF